MRLPPTLDPHTRNELLKVDKFLKQLTAALNRSIEGNNNPRAVISGGGGGGGGSSANLPDHKHSAPGDGGAQLGVHGGVIKGYGMFLFVDPTAPQVQIGDASNGGDDLILQFFYDPNGTADPGKTILTFGQNNTALGGPQTTADDIGSAGARLYLYKDVTGIYDAAYGQSFTDNWVMPGPEDINYGMYTGAHPGTPFVRCFWAGNGDYTNYGFIKTGKNGSAALPSSPGVLFEETGAGTQYIAVRAPNAVTSNREQLLFNVSGRIPVTGDDPPAVAAGYLGKVDETGKTAAIGSTNLTNGALSGIYQINYYLECTTANAGASSVTFQVNYTDSVGATNHVGSTALVCTATGHAVGSITVYVASGELSYQTNWTTPSSAVMNARARVTYLG